MKQITTPLKSSPISHPAELASESKTDSRTNQSISKVDSPEKQIQGVPSTSDETTILTKIDLPSRTCSSEEEALNYFATWDETYALQPCPYECEGKQEKPKAPIRILIEHLCQGHNHNYPYVCKSSAHTHFALKPFKA